MRDLPLAQLNDLVWRPMSRLMLRHGLLAVGVGVLLAGCATLTPPGAKLTATAPAAVAATEPIGLATSTPTSVPATPSPTVAPTQIAPIVQPTTSPEQIAAYTLELSATVAAWLPPVPTPDASGYAPPGFEGVAVRPLTTTNGVSLWLAHSYGLRYFLDGINHFVAFFTHDGRDWQQVLKFDLLDSDYISTDSVRQVLIEPTHIWIAVDSGAGAHSGCFNLYEVDPVARTVNEAVSNCSDHPGAGEVRDLNGDGQLDVLLDHTNSYVFCYACGVRLPAFSVLRWEGTQLISQTLTPLPESAPAELRQAVNRAVELANGGLWKDAQALMVQSGAARSAEPLAQWNAALIGVYDRALRAQIDYQPYPLLDYIFHGDYAAALNVMRPYPPDQLFSLTGPLIKGTVAETWESTLAFWVAQATDGALKAQPDLAAAYFLRGWAAYLVDKRNPAALVDLEKAAQLAPNEPLFSESVAFLK